MKTEGFMNIAPLDPLPLSQTTIDLDVNRRGERGLVERLLAQDSTGVVLVRDGKIAAARSDGSQGCGERACADDPAAPRPDARAPQGPMDLLLLSAPVVHGAVDRYGLLTIYLGFERESNPRAYFLAVDISSLSGDGLRACGLEDIVEAATWAELRSFAPCASPRDVGLATSAVAVCTWHANQRFCPACGAPVRPVLSGWAQTCTSPDDPDRLLFARIEPAIITAIVDDDDRLLLQHNRAWRPKFFSVSAGFVEAGESLERAVRRETMEEVGIELDEVCYLGSQPWPFPASIMLAFRAHAASTEIAVDNDEVAFARWFTREELVRAVSSGEIEPPGRASIARHMVEQWLGRPLEECCRIAG